MVQHEKQFPLREGAYQILCAIVAHSLALQYGAHIIFSTIIIPTTILTGNDVGNNGTFGDNNVTNNNGTFYNYTESDYIEINKEEASWIASILNIGMLVGSPAAGVVLDYWGAKFGCIATSVTFTLAWMFTALSNSDIRFLYVSRALAGIGSGMAFTGTNYVAETSHHSIRSHLVSLSPALIAFGTLVTMLLGYVSTWKIVAIVMGTVSVITLISLTFLPESPIWLAVKKGRDFEREEKIRSVLQRLYRKKEHQDEAYLEIREISNKKIMPLQKDVEESTSLMTAFRKWKAVILLSLMYLIQRLTGVLVVVTYMLQILQAVGSTATDEWVSALILVVTRTITSTLPVFFAIGRRTLLMTSASGMAISIFFGATWLYFKGPSIICTITILLYTFCATFGATIIPSVLVSELLPNELRGMGSGIVFAFDSIVTFAISKLFISVLDVMGMVNILYSFGVFSLVFILFVSYLIPETLNRPFDEIAKSLK